MGGAPPRASIVDAVRTYGEGSGDRLGKSWRVRIDDNDMLVMPVTLGRSATLGGVRIDGGGRVLTASGEHVEGLFAAGEITGGVHGMRCVPGNLSLESVVFGREAGFPDPGGGFCGGGPRRLTAGRMRASLSGLRPDPECGRSRLRSGP